MAPRSFLFTSESVTEGHPDKMADQISDAILDAVLTEDPLGRVACETLITTGLVVVAGEITTQTYVDIPRLVRRKVREIGYDRAKYGFDAETCGVIVALDEQSPDIAQGVDAAYEVQHDPGDDDPLDREGAGDQGMMFGYATDETEELMPMPITLAHLICRRLAEVRKADVLPYLRPDGKAQVTVRYEADENGRVRPVEIVRVLISTQHREGLDADALIKPDLAEHVLHPILPGTCTTRSGCSRTRTSSTATRPASSSSAGRWATPASPAARSSSIPTAAPPGTEAVRSPARIRPRSTGLPPMPPATSRRTSSRPVSPSRCELQVAYAIGVAHPVSLEVDCFGTERDGITTGRIEELVRATLRPQAGRDHQGPRSAPADLREDRRVRPLRPRRPRLHLGARRQGRGAPRGRRASIR